MPIKKKMLRKKQSPLSRLWRFATSRAILASLAVLVVVAGYVSYEFTSGTGIKSLLSSSPILEIRETISDFITAQPVEIMVVGGNNLILTGDPEVDAYLAAKAVKKDGGSAAAQAAAAKTAAQKSAEISARNQAKDSKPKTAVEIYKAVDIAKTVEQANSDQGPSGPGQSSGATQQVDLSMTCGTSAGFSVGIGETMIGAGDAIYTCDKVDGKAKWVPLATCGDGNDQCTKSNVVTADNPNGTVVLTVKPSYLAEGKNCEKNGVVVGNGSTYSAGKDQFRCDNGNFTKVEVFAGRFVTEEEKKQLEAKRIEDNKNNCNAIIPGTNMPYGKWNEDKDICEGGEYSDQIAKNAKAFDEARKTCLAKNTDAAIIAKKTWEFVGGTCVEKGATLAPPQPIAYLNLAECLEAKAQLANAKDKGCRISNGIIEIYDVTQATEKIADLADKIAACRKYGADIQQIWTYSYTAHRCVPESPQVTDESKVVIVQPPNADKFTYKVGEVCEAGTAFACAKNCAGGVVSVIDTGTIEGNVYICGDAATANQVAKEKNLLPDDATDTEPAKVVAEPKAAGEGCLLEGNNGCKSGICKFGLPTSLSRLPGWYCAQDDGEFPATLLPGHPPAEEVAPTSEVEPEVVSNIPVEPASLFSAPGEACSVGWLFPQSDSCVYDCKRVWMLRSASDNTTKSGWYCTDATGNVPISTNVPPVTNNPATQSSYLKCGDNMVDTATDNRNCGSCGNVCGVDELCIGGGCL